MKAPLKERAKLEIMAMTEHRREEELESAAARSPTPTGTKTEPEITRERISKGSGSSPPPSGLEWSSYQVTDIAVKILAGLVIASLQIYSYKSEANSQREMSIRTTAVDIVRFYKRDVGEVSDSLVGQYPSLTDPLIGNAYPSLTESELQALKAPADDAQKKNRNKVKDYLNYVEFVVRSWDNNTADRQILRESYKANFDRFFAYFKPYVDYQQSTVRKSSWGIIYCVLKVWDETPQPEFDSSKTCANRQAL